MRGRRSPAGLALCLVASVLASVLVACDRDRARSDADLAHAAAVRVEAEGCHPGPSVGAGSFVAKNRILTVAHVVAGSTEVDVVLPDGSEHHAEVVAIDRQKDLAVLSATAGAQPLRVGRMRPGTQGAMIVWRGGQLTPITFTARTVVDINAADIDNTTTGLRRGYEISAVVAPGDSGSVLVADGLAVGVLFARSNRGPNRAWATDIGEATPLIASKGDTPVDTGPCS
jgi:S1-C subfamily serine protease